MYEWKVISPADVVILPASKDRPWLPYIRLVGSEDVGPGLCLHRSRTFHTLIQSIGIHHSNVKDIVNYLTPLINKAKELLGGCGVREMADHVSLFLLATAGMRRLEETNNRKYHALRNEIIRFLTSQGLWRGAETWKMITGEEEALYGWVTANYSLRNFRKKSNELCGFVEMGGASMQIAYQPRKEEWSTYQGNLTKLKMVWGGLDETFVVFTKTFLGLGADMALESHRRNLAPAVVQIMDPCSPFGYAAPGHFIVGTGFFPRRSAPPPDSDPVEQQGEDNVAPPQVLKNAQDHLRNLFNCPCESRNRCVDLGKACLLKGHPNLVTHRFLGGAKFWYATSGIFNSGTEYTPEAFKIAIDDFGKISWKKHRDTTISRLHRKFNKEVGQDLTIKEDAKLTKELGFKATALFSANLVYCCLHDGFGIPDANFMPFNGVVEEDNYGNHKEVAYSWTLGVVVLQITGAKPERKSRTGWFANDLQQQD